MTVTNKGNEPHHITKFIRNYNSDYYCEEHNTSYPTKKSLKEDHPELHDHIITIYVKRSTGETRQCRFCGMNLSSDGFRRRHEDIVHYGEELPCLI